MRLSDRISSNELLSSAEVMRILKCSYNHLRKLPLAFIRLGRVIRYRAADVQAFIQGKSHV
ncbi:helix-turn-helix domain-containing protein [Faunimonas sp. B44]|uniref:helix-turn-helix domain-containing protein n=1 Tax=Faunimonas sp. B44 TaxID=3461493 RepID=UPI004043D91A